MGAAGARVVVLGAYHPSAVAVIQSLGRRGIDVVAVDAAPDALGFRSRWVGSRHVVGTAPEDVWTLLENLRAGGGLLVPTDDHYLAAIARRAEALAEAFVVPVPSWSVMAPLLRRTRSLALAREAGLRVPRHRTFRDAAEMDAAIAALDPEAPYLVCRDDFSRPCVLDPASGRSVAVAGPGLAAVRRVCHDVLARTGQLPVIADVVPGRSEDAVGVVALVDRRHEIVLSYAMRRRLLATVRTGGAFVHPYDLGWASRCESVVDAEAVAAAQALLRHVRYCGVAVVEFRRDARDGGLVFVKLDMRIDRAATLATALGLDLADATYDLFVHGRRPAPRPYAPGVSWLWLTRHASDLIHNRTRIDLARELAAFAVAAGRARAFAYLGTRDPRPFLTDLARWTGRAARRGARWLGRRLRRPGPVATTASSDDPPAAARGRRS